MLSMAARPKLVATCSEALCTNMYSNRDVSKQIKVSVALEDIKTYRTLLYCLCYKAMEPWSQVSIRRAWLAWFNEDQNLSR